MFHLLSVRAGASSEAPLSQMPHHKMKILTVTIEFIELTHVKFFLETSKDTEHEIILSNRNIMY